MSWQLALAIFFVAWWVCFLAVLPWGVKTPDEAGEEIVPGQARSAPVKPHFRRKMLVTTVIAALITGIGWLNMRYKWVTFDSLPGPEKLY